MRNCRCGLNSEKTVFVMGCRFVEPRGYCFIKCPKCGQHTSEHNSIQDAIKEWNKIQGRKGEV